MTRHAGWGLAGGLPAGAVGRSCRLGLPRGCRLPAGAQLGGSSRAGSRDHFRAAATNFRAQRNAQRNPLLAIHRPQYHYRVWLPMQAPAGSLGFVSLWTRR